METPTRRQMDILRYVRDYRDHFGYSPTMQEIGDHLGLTKVTVFEHVGGLERKGLLLRGKKHFARSLQVSPRFKFVDEKPSRIPMLGRVVAGSPIEAIENRQILDLETLFAAGGEKFVLEVSGQSMIDDHIQEGDYVICERKNNPRNGQIVVALLPDGEATLKRFYREKDRIRLQPANVTFKPIFVEPGKIDIQGIVVGVIRKV